ncbi:MAG: hypothetical protein AB2531_04725, partial [Candidatus Thiodiazotropha sp.]
MASKEILKNAEEAAMNQGLHGLTTPKALELWAQKYKCLEHPIVKKTILTQMTDGDDSLLYHAEPQLLPKTDEAQAEADVNDEDDDLLFHAQSQLLPEKEEDLVSSSARNDDDMLFHAETQMLAAEDPASKQDQGTPGESQDILLFAKTSQTEMSDSQLQKLIFGQSRDKCNPGPISDLANQLLAGKVLTAFNKMLLPISLFYDQPPLLLVYRLRSRQILLTLASTRPN